MLPEHATSEPLRHLELHPDVVDAGTAAGGAQKFHEAASRGTLICALERRRVIDLLPDREPASSGMAGGADGVGESKCSRGCRFEGRSDLGRSDLRIGQDTIASQGLVRTNLVFVTETNNGGV